MKLNTIIGLIKETKDKDYFVIIIKTPLCNENLIIPLTKEKYDIIKKLKENFNEDCVFIKDTTIKIDGYFGATVDDIFNFTILNKSFVNEDDILPQDVWIRQRISTIGHVINKYMSEGKDIPIEYTHELTKLNDMLHRIINESR